MFNISYRKTNIIKYFKSPRFQIHVIIFIAIVIFYKQLNDSESSIIMNRKYITSSFEHPSDLGNMFFRFASLYGIGKDLGRIPYVNGSILLQLNGLTEISEYFPILHDTIQVKVPHKSLVTLANFTDFCCVYEKPKNLEKYKNAKYLKISANYLQSYKFFDNYFTDISKMMECSDIFNKQSKVIGRNLWKNSNSNNLHKMCVHVRRGDFVGNWPLETRTDFTLPAIKYIFEKLTAKQKKNISLLFLGNDEKFIVDFSKSINMDFQSIDNLFGFNTSRSFDMCFGIQQCDSLLISASSSTYAWWIGYLMKSQGPVYYNAVITKSGTHAKDHFDYDLFPPHWTKLFLQNDTVKIETKWTVERNKIGK